MEITLNSTQTSDCEESDDNKLTIDFDADTTKDSVRSSSSNFPNFNYPENVINSLWNSKAMGDHGPEELLVALWFYTTHYFGLSSRIDHAKMILANVEIKINDQTNEKSLIFHELNETFNRKFDAQPMPEMKDKSKCPVAIYESYLSHRPSNMMGKDAPFYLQPDKNSSNWFCPQKMGKNRIGALFNSALMKSGQACIRHFNNRRQMTTKRPSKQLPDKQQEVNSTEEPANQDIKSPKIRLKISRLNSGNPVVSQTLIEEAEETNIVTIATLPSDKEEESKKNEEKEDQEIYALKNQRYLLKNGSIGEKHHHRRGGWSLQKSILNVTSKETNPIVRHLMMHLMMNPDILLPGDCKLVKKPDYYSALIGQSGKSILSNQRCSLRNKSSSSYPSASANIGSASTRSVVLQRVEIVKELSLWQPTSDAYCDKELMSLMNYSFDFDLTV